MSLKGVLDGVKVLDLSRVLAGPYCGMMLADMGADVLKIEIPQKGDDARRNAPLIQGGESSYFLNLNRNKKGITLNLKSPEGKEIFLKLVKEVDIVIENYRPGVMDKLGLGYDTLREINPAIVYGAISGFGQYGPYSKRAGYDIIAQAMSGLMSTTGWPDSGPTRSGTAIGDVAAGMSCCIGILAAYVNRLKTGKGEFVDVALVDSLVSALEIINMIYLCTGRVPSRIGNRYEAIYPYDSFRAADGNVIIACGNDKLYDSLKSLLQLRGMDDAMFDGNINRVANHEPLKKIIETWTSVRTIDEVVDTLLAAGIPAAPINTIDRVVNDPHIAGARQMFVECEHPVAGKVTLTGTPVKFKAHDFSIYRPAPRLSEHTQEILGSLGYTPAEIDGLRERGVI